MLQDFKKSKKWQRTHLIIFSLMFSAYCLYMLLGKKKYMERFHGILMMRFENEIFKMQLIKKPILSKRLSLKRKKVNHLFTQRFIYLFNFYPTPLFSPVGPKVSSFLHFIHTTTLWGRWAWECVTGPRSPSKLLRQSRDFNVGLADPHLALWPL